MPYLSTSQRQLALLCVTKSNESPILDLEPAHGARTIRVRPIGMPYGYVRYSAAMSKWALASDGSSRAEPGPHPFPDDGHPADHRVGLTAEQALALGIDECPYAARGWVPQHRWAMNVLEILGPDVFQVRVLEGPRSLWEYFWGFEKANRERNAEKGHRRYVEDAGGAVTHLFDVVVTPPKLRRPRDLPYHVEFGEQTEISESEVEALAKVGRPSTATLVHLRAQHSGGAALEKAPDWTFFGHPLWRMFASHM